MLNDIYSESEILEINTRFRTSLSFFSRLLTCAKPKEKHKFVYPIRAAGFSFKTANDLGFIVSKKLWVNCLHQGERNLGKIFLF